MDENGHMNMQHNQSEQSQHVEQQKSRVVGERSNIPRGDRRSNNRTNKSRSRRGVGAGTSGYKKPRKESKPRQPEQIEYESQLLEVKRVTRVVKGGKRTRFAALVVVGDRNGSFGIGFKKGMDFQDAVSKATRKGRENIIKLELNENGSIKYPLSIKYKSARIFLKPANKGTGLIAGGYLRPVLELAGVENIYTKIVGSSSKITGVYAIMKALSSYNT